jgi:hypothetical protein
MIVEIKRSVIREEVLNEMGTTVQLVKGSGEHYIIQAKLKKDEEFQILDTLSDLSVSFIGFNAAIEFLQMYCKKYFRM